MIRSFLQRVRTRLSAALEPSVWRPPPDRLTEDQIVALVAPTYTRCTLEEAEVNVDGAKRACLMRSSMPGNTIWKFYYLYGNAADQGMQYIWLQRRAE